ncbi:DedA family protein [Acidihalobacter prosperus]|uniref:DedA family protein n=1 Tax=Acidihalobacter prosperus TaxID=160660 RepID=A0A1A6C8Q4_9GAMM|nr:hypothetical protein [Acidihalobacter prosperus]OBS10948.1 hypothetical protein Thpro_020664 [Acidihalobacter prosperus]
MNPWRVFGSALLAALTGYDNFGYPRGSSGEGRFLLRTRSINPHPLARVQRLFRRKGLWIARRAPILDGRRQFNAPVAGMIGMPWRRFVAQANASVCLAWAAIWTPYARNEHLDTVLDPLTPLRPVLLPLAAGMLVTLAAYPRARLPSRGTET